MSKFKQDLSKTVSSLKARTRPLIVTHHGRPAAVVLSPAAYDLLVERSRFVESVQAGIADAESGRVISDDTLLNTMVERLGWDDAVDAG